MPSGGGNACFPQATQWPVIKEVNPMLLTGDTQIKNKSQFNLKEI
jgi:hypothetical protein